MISIKKQEADNWADIPCFLGTVARLDDILGIKQGWVPSVVVIQLQTRYTGSVNPVQNMHSISIKII
jgi:hypothetical protein